MLALIRASLLHPLFSSSTSSIPIRFPCIDPDLSFLRRPVHFIVLSCKPRYPIRQSRSQRLRDFQILLSLCNTSESKTLNGIQGTVHISTTLRTAKVNFDIIGSNNSKDYLSTCTLLRAPILNVGIVSISPVLGSRRPLSTRSAYPITVRIAEDSTTGQHPRQNSHDRESFNATSFLLEVCRTTFAATTYTPPASQ
ncbi:hypothetical protein P153DRAFT_118683 [Dothidotthia symphoricarpi CBS 119687]|uniref:Uncharacterized protein n=1 Tax=Dothidotthia symphoricarpi CBS 119687 TaxID=1392245 RepID=A0A6A6A2T5_9PLEO|nr:uncharacterized protein P153DRAFT_118683 [Dothidotthia symphoricarpi CBS 119687]KAF2125048.1 hypothetical protein P153DRAFT_118683 [Dothidotthia symphoricarpi CBS 119687]